VAYIDGSVLAQLGTPDMRTPIAFALGWPDRIKAPSRRLDLAEIGQLSFHAPDPERFPALELARSALQDGGASPTILNAANEVAVQGYLNGKIGFLDICRVVEITLERAPRTRINRLEDVYAVDTEARRRAEEIISASVLSA
jgi:1-deoxy-D-xylulose-5-phosphate reductoisomerase